LRRDRGEKDTVEGKCIHIALKKRTGPLAWRFMRRKKENLRDYGGKLLNKILLFIFINTPSREIVTRQLRSDRDTLKTCHPFQDNFPGVNNYSGKVSNISIPQKHKTIDLALP